MRINARLSVHGTNQLTIVLPRSIICQKPFYDSSSFISLVLKNVCNGGLRNKRAIVREGSFIPVTKSFRIWRS